jgi:HMG box factor
VLTTVESTAIGAGDRSVSRSPTRLEAAKEAASQFCLCQPDPKIPRPRNGKQHRKLICDMS